METTVGLLDSGVARNSIENPSIARLNGSLDYLARSVVEGDDRVIWNCGNRGWDAGRGGEVGWNTIATEEVTIDVVGEAVLLATQEKTTTNFFLVLAVKDRADTVS